MGVGLGGGSRGRAGARRDEAEALGTYWAPAIPMTPPALWLSPCPRRAQVSCIPLVSRGKHRGQGTRPESFNRSGLRGRQLPVASGLLAPFPEMRVSTPPTQLTFTPHLPSQTWPGLLLPQVVNRHRRHGPAFAGFRLSSVRPPLLSPWIM